MNLWNRFDTMVKKNKRDNDALSRTRRMASYPKLHNRQKRTLVSITRNPKRRRQLRNLMNLDVEYKYRDLNSLTPDNISSDAPTLTHLTPIAAGNTNITRNGRTITLTSVQLRMKIQYNNAASTPCQVVRVTIFQWFEETPPQISDIFSWTSNPYSYHKVSDRKLYNILASRFYVLGDIAGQPNCIPVEIFKKMNSKVVYAGDTGNDYTYGAIFMFAQSDTTGATGNLPTMTFNSRVRFTG